jgi:hypothetical protein
VFSSFHIFFCNKKIERGRLGFLNNINIIKKKFSHLPVSGQRSRFLSGVCDLAPPPNTAFQTALEVPLRPLSNNAREHAWWRVD